MSTTARIAAFAVGLLVAFAAAWGAGAAVAPVLDEPVASHDMGDESEGEAHTDDAPHAAEEATHLPGGLLVSQDGYTLELPGTTQRPGRATLRFTITGPDGAPVTSYDVEHEKQLHLIAVRRDFSGYQHVHPTLSQDGVWTTDLDLTPGSWRVFADFRPTGGEAVTLGTDLQVTGRFRPTQHPGSVTSTEVDGYAVELIGSLDEGAVSVRVSRDGEPVTDLQPYLGAYGHLVALREGDLAYLHVHPEASDAGPEVPFGVELPSAGGYRLFFDFKHDGVVRTAQLAVRAHAGGGNHGH